MTRDITYSLKLPILATDKIIVPGCEPATYSSSVSLAANMHCGRALVDLADALAAIPGSFVETFATPYQGYRTKFFVLPPKLIDCSCEPVVDYYAILKEIATTEEPETRDYDYCATLDQGFCPSPDFDLLPPPPASTYGHEGDLSLATALRNQQSGT